MSKKSRQIPNEAYFQILRKLSARETLRRTDFEQPKPTVTNIKTKFEHQKQTRLKYIPHSSLILRLNELSNSHYIISKYSGEKSKKGDSILEYSITFFGFIKLLQLCEEGKFYSDIMKNTSRIAPKIIWIKIEQILKSKILNEKQLFDVLVTVSKNTEIQIDFNPWRASGTTITKPISIPKALRLGDKIKWIHVFDVEMTIRQINHYYKIRETFLSYGKTRTKQEIKLQDFKQQRHINHMFIFAFTNELIMRCYRQDGYTRRLHPMDKRFLLKIIKRDNILSKIFIDEVSAVELQQGDENEIINKVKKALKS